MNRDPTPTNDNFFVSPEPGVTRKKLGGGKLSFVALGLLFLVIVGYLARQPVTYFIGQLVTFETNGIKRNPQGRSFGICGIGINKSSEKTVVQILGKGVGSKDFIVLSSDNKRVESTIADAIYEDSHSIVEKKVAMSDYQFVNRFSFLEFNEPLTDREIIAAIRPFLTEVQLLRQQTNGGNGPSQ